MFLVNLNTTLNLRQTARTYLVQRLLCKKNWNRLLCKKIIIAYYAKIIIILGSIDGLMHDDWNLVGHVAGFQESGIG